MHHELQAMERQGMEERIHELETMLDDMHADFAKCAKDKVPICCFCANYGLFKRCTNNCNFIWNKHN